MAALCFKYLDISIQIKSNKVAHSPIMPNHCIRLKDAGIAIQQIISFLLQIPAQETEDCPADKHYAENTSEPEEPMMTRLDYRLCLCLLRWWLLLSSWR